jgi:gamma-glutamyltranspeptidase / glutathione hydrolase
MPLPCALVASLFLCQPQLAPQTEPPAPKHAAPQVYSTAAVAADHQLASEAGAEILRLGGNAVDAAVATSLTLSVVRPESCGIGGGGFMIINLVNDPRHGNVSVALNYREECPAAIGPDFFTTPQGNALKPPSSITGGAAVAIPGTIAGLCTALDTYGTLDRATVFAPAIRAAEQGFLADAHYIGASKSIAARREKFFERSKLRLPHELAGNSSAIPALGQRITNPDHARALKLIAQDGPAAFYSGAIADAIVASSSVSGGVLTHEDLRNYQVQTLQPMTIQFRGRTILTMPPPSSGGIVMAETFGILERRSRDLDAAIARGPSSSQFLHLFAEAMQHGFADRANWLGGGADQPGPGSPLARLLTPEYLDARAATIDLNRTLTPDAYGSSPQAKRQLPTDGGTSHFSVVDSRGGVVSCTETINLEFGSLVMVDGFGFILNNQMDDFTTEPGKPNAFGLIQSAANAPSPGRRPLSSMTPMIALDASGNVELVAGAAGGPRIISATMQSSLNVMLFSMSAEDALASPRIHHQWMPKVLFAEPGILESPAAGELQKLGHIMKPAPQAAAQLIRRTPGGWNAASDARKGGKPAGF